MCCLATPHVKAGRTGLDQVAVLPRGVMKGERGVTDVCQTGPLYDLRELETGEEGKAGGGGSGLGQRKVAGSPPCGAC